MGTFIFITIMAIAGYFFFKLKTESTIEKYLKEQGIKNPTKEDIQEEIKKRESKQRVIELEKIQKFKEEIEERKTKKEFKPYTAEERKAYGEKQKEKIRKGKEYEAYVAEYYRSLGYEVIEHGKIMGRKDAGIDLIAKNHREAIMIQCKNWKAGSKYTINHETISAFVGKVEMFLAKNIEYQQYEIKRIFTVSEPILDKSALAIINENRDMIRYEHIPIG